MASTKQKIGDVLGRIPNPFKKPTLPEPYGTGRDTQGNSVIVPGGEMTNVISGTGGYARPSGYGSGGGSSPSSPGTTGKTQEQIIAEQKVIADAQAKLQAEAEKLRQANAQANLRKQSLSSGYQTKTGYKTAIQRQADRQADRQAYTDYKKLEAQTLAKSYNEAYKTYRNTGLSENEARYKASQWRKATVADIKASGGITTYSQSEIPKAIEPIIISELDYRNLELNTKKGNQSDIDRLKEIKDSGGGYETIPAEKRDWVRTEFNNNKITNVKDLYKTSVEKLKTDNKERIGDKIISAVAPYIKPSETKLPTNVKTLFFTSTDKLKSTGGEKIGDKIINTITPYISPGKTTLPINAFGIYGTSVSKLKTEPSNLLNRPLSFISKNISPGKTETKKNVLDLQRESLSKIQSRNRTNLINFQTTEPKPRTTVFNLWNESTNQLENKPSTLLNRPLNFIADNISTSNKQLPTNVLDLQRESVKRLNTKPSTLLNKPISFIVGGASMFFNGTTNRPLPKNVKDLYKESTSQFKKTGVGDIDIFGGINKARNIEYQNEATAKRVISQVNSLNNLTGKEREDKIKQLESAGVKFERKFDKGEYQDIIVYPNWITNLRPDFEKKTQKETFVPFFFRKLNTGVSTSTADIYQRAVFKGATLLEPNKLVLLEPESKKVGKVIGTGFELLMYAVPVVGTTAFLGGTAEAITRGKGFVKFAKEEPFQIIGAGTYGVLQTPRIRSFISSLGRTEIKTSSVIPKDVLSGKNRFPLAPTSKHKELFLTSEYNLPNKIKPTGYHASPNKLPNKLVIGTSESELPGLYLSYGVSPNFLKVGGESKQIFSLEALNILKKPGVANVEPIAFRINQAVKTSKGYKFTRETIPGIADLPLIKKEVESILPPGTELTKTAGDYYFKYKGYRIPIDEFSVKGSESSKSADKVFTTKKLESSYSLPKSSPAFSEKSVTPLLNSKTSEIKSEVISIPKENSLISSNSKPSSVSKVLSSVKSSGSSSSNKSSSSSPVSSLQSSPSSFSSPSSMSKSSSSKSSRSSASRSNYSNVSKSKPNISSIISAFKSDSSKYKALSKVKENPELFEVYGKRFGKDIKIFSTSNQRQAEEKALKFLKGTLGRSAVIKKSGRALDFGELDLFKNQEFRPAKKDRQRIVQEAKYSLSSSPERKEIQYFKKKSKKRGLFF